MTKLKIILIIIIAILIAGNIFFSFQYLANYREARRLGAIANTQKINEQVLAFAKLFIEKVLKAETEASFETRLQLENAVRNLDDNKIMTQWQKFVESKTEAEAQEEVKNLLSIVIEKISLVK